MPNKPGGGSGEAGFYRRGFPNRPRVTENPDDPRALIRVATDMMIGARKTIADNPEWGVRQDEVDEKRDGFSERGKRDGLKVLEDELETAMREMGNDRGANIGRLGLALAYLELTEGVDEDHLDTDRE